MRRSHHIFAHQPWLIFLEVWSSPHYLLWRPHASRRPSIPSLSDHMQRPPPKKEGPRRKSKRVSSLGVTCRDNTRSAPVLYDYKTMKVGQTVCLSHFIHMIRIVFDQKSDRGAGWRRPAPMVMYMTTVTRSETLQVPHIMWWIWSRRSRESSIFFTKWSHKNETHITTFTDAATVHTVSRLLTSSILGS